MLVVNSYKNTGVLTVTKHNGINFTIRQFLLVFDLYFLSRILLSSRLKEGYVGLKQHEQVKRVYYFDAASTN